MSIPVQRARAPIAIGLGTVSIMAGSIFVASCGPQRVPLDVRFPSTETFLVSGSMRIRIYELEETSCASLVTAVSNGRDPSTTPLWESDELTPCTVRAGVSIPDVGGGQLGFLVEGLDSNGNNTILAGCSEAEVFSGGRIDVAVYPTSRYDAAYRASMLGSESIAQRCDGGGS